MKTFSTVAAIVAVILVLLLFFSVLNVNESVMTDTKDAEVQDESADNTVTQSYYVPYEDVVEQTMNVVAE